MATKAKTDIDTYPRKMALLGRELEEDDDGDEPGMKSLPRKVHTLEEPTVPGAERLTLIEQLIDRLRLPYSVGCLVLAVMTGFLGVLLSNLLETLDFNRAVEGVLAPYSQRAAWSGVLDITVNTAIIFYMLIMIRYMRQKVVDMEPKLIGLTPDGAKTLHRIFGPVSNPRGQLASAVILLVVIQAFLETLGGPSTAVGGNSLLSIIVSWFVGALFYITVGTFVWIYSSSLWGLHRLGREPLRLKSMHEDRLMGVGIVGSLSLSLAIAYYSVFGPIALESVILSPDAIGYATLLPLVMLGGLMFFLPLYSIHEKMVEQKELEEKSVMRQLAELVARHDNPGSEPRSSVSDQVDRLLKLGMLQLSEKRLQEVPTWPFDKKTLEQFAAIFLSVLSALLGRLALAVTSLPG